LRRFGNYIGGDVDSDEGSQEETNAVDGGDAYLNGDFDEEEEEPVTNGQDLMVVDGECSASGGKEQC
jgi:hypothetical protein